MNLVEDKIRAYLDPMLEAEDCFLVDLKHLPGNKLMVYLDKDSGITISKCVQFSRYLRNYLEEEALLGDDYSLEVSSPGADQPLKLHRQYVKNVGKALKVVLNDGITKTGELIAVEENNIEINDEATGSEKINFDQIKRSTVIIKI